LKFNTISYYCGNDEIKKPDLAKNFDVKTYYFIMSVHCPSKVKAFEPSTIKSLCLEVAKLTWERINPSLKKF